MNKTQLVEAISKDAGITKAETKKVLNSFIKTAIGSLKKGEKLTLVGFGSFTVTDKPERQGRNPRTGASIKIAAKKSVKFKPGMEMLLAVKKN
jgi:DNA-binding protein HU-beta